ncbi:MAG: aromatic amino acid ammonia-lyase, partial [Patescibacteria group bacterium]
MKKILVGPDIKLTPAKVYEISHNMNIGVQISPAAERAVRRSRRVVEKMIDQEAVIYGVTTGFGNFKNKHIRHDEIAALQRNLIRSHAAGVGQFFSSETVRAILLVRLNSLIQGYSGVRLELISLLCNIINKGIIPLIPSQGSVGSSGDLAPLSHAGLVLIGEGEVEYKKKRISGDKALKLAGLKPISFSAKEGLAWNNGTSAMTAVAALALHRAEKLIDAADMSCALTLEAVCGITAAFDERIHKVRPHPGQMESARRILDFVKGSKLVNSFPDRIQDSYSLRCSPQVHGAVLDAVSYVPSVVESELNAATDNPLIFSGADIA